MNETKNILPHDTYANTTKLATNFTVTSNFVSTSTTKGRNDANSKGKDHIHNQLISDQNTGVQNHQQTRFSDKTKNSKLGISIIKGKNYNRGCTCALGNCTDCDYNGVKHIVSKLNTSKVPNKKYLS